MKTRKTNTKRRQGFTLMEVLLVLVILVVLMGFAVPSLLGSKKKADMDAAKTQIGLLRTALEKYALDLNTFPSTEQGLEVLVVKPTDLEEEVAANWAGPYITTTSKEAPKDPWGHEYLYEFPSTHDSEYPDIWSAGPDGKEGTEDDIVNWSEDDSTS
ncbi:MAG: type II secretion system protein GspG [Planctomycetota bacterium]|nr:MAG: type II secretion system protein GspG [Planctomycetota bacterium]